MSQASLVIANGSGAAVRANLNAALGALVSSNSGASAPSPTYPGMPWLDTSVSPAVHKVRNAANTAWLTVLPETQAAETFWGNSGLSAAAPGEIAVSAALGMLDIDVDTIDMVLSLPGGMKLMCGEGTTTATGLTVTFPEAFTVTPQVLITPISSAPRTFHVQGRTTAEFEVHLYATGGSEGAYNFSWLAMGK